jgi:hypothetical protein
MLLPLTLTPHGLSPLVHRHLGQPTRSLGALQLTSRGSTSPREHLSGFVQQPSAGGSQALATTISGAFGTDADSFGRSYPAILSNPPFTLVKGSISGPYISHLPRNLEIMMEERARASGETRGCRGLCLAARRSRGNIGMAGEIVAQCGADVR